MNEDEIVQHDLLTSTLYNNSHFDLNNLLLFEGDDCGNSSTNGNSIGPDEKDDYEKKKNTEIKEFYTKNENKIACRSDALCNKSIFHEDKGKEVEIELEAEAEKSKKQNEKDDERELELIHANVSQHENEGINEIINQLEKKETNGIVAYHDRDKKCSSDISTTAELSKAETISTDGVILTIHNIICSANLGIQIDLRLVAVSIRNAEYNPRKANTLIVRLNKPNSTALIFQTGRIMLTGAQTVSDAIYGCRKVGKIIKKVTKKPVILKNFKIENMIAKADCNMPVRLESLAHDHKEYCNYEPELFAGLIFRYNPSGQHKSVILIFVSGKMVISGCRSVQKLNTVFQDVYNILKEYSI